MVMTPGRVALTYQDYAALPDDGRRYEIHEGELSVTPAPGSKHQIVSSNLVWALETQVRSRGLGLVLCAPLDVILSDRTIVQPDIVFLATDRVGRISERGVEGGPTLVVEILSPSTRETDRNAKLRLYASYGVPWYWIVDPDARTVETYKLVAGSYTLSARIAGDEPLGAEPFPDLALAPTALWA
jgi:Uma2 family endonuclease